MSAKARYQSFLGSDHWRELREAKILDSDGKCEKCGRRSQLHVHHKTYERRGRERLDDLQVLCENCHYGVHTVELLSKFPSKPPECRKLADLEALLYAAMRNGQRGRIKDFTYKIEALKRKNRRGINSSAATVVMRTAPHGPRDSLAGKPV